eukprot:gene15228-21310_t
MRTRTKTHRDAWHWRAIQQWAEPGHTLEDSDQDKDEVYMTLLKSQEEYKANAQVFNLETLYSPFWDTPGAQHRARSIRQVAPGRACGTPVQFGVATAAAVAGCRQVGSCKKLSANDPSLAHLTVLKHRKFDHSEVTKFSAALKGNTHLTELNASCHELTPETASVLGTALPLCQIASLSVGTSTFGDETLRALSTGLKDGAVKRLDLENKGLTQAGAEVCADILASSRNLTHLVLSRNQLGNAGAEALGKGPWSAPLEHLDLRSCGITADGLDAMLASPSTAAASSGSDATTAPFSLLKHMVLSGNQLGPTGGPAVAKLLTTATRMEELYLSNTDLGSGAVKELGNGLSQHPSIMILDLTSVGVDDDAG